MRSFYIQLWIIDVIYKRHMATKFPEILVAAGIIAEIFVDQFLKGLHYRGSTLPYEYV